MKQSWETTKRSIFTLECPELYETNQGNYERGGSWGIIIRESSKATKGPKAQQQQEKNNRKPAEETFALSSATKEKLFHKFNSWHMEEQREGERERERGVEWDLFNFSCAISQAVCVHVCVCP